MMKKGQFRNVIVRLEGELKDTYLDGEGNVFFGNFYLWKKNLGSSTKSVVTTQLVPVATIEKKRSLHSITKDMVCPKFVAKNQNAEV